MDKLIIAGANGYDKKYYINNDTKILPDQVKNTLKEICVLMANKLNCIFIIKFDENNQLKFETITEPNDYNFDDIGAELEIKKLRKENEELFEQIALAYRVFYHQD